MAIFTQISQTVLGADTATITFSSIPGTYTNLLLTFYARADTVASEESVKMQFNSDTGANYHVQLLAGSGGTASAAEQLNQSYIRLGKAPAASATANYFGASVSMIYSYANTSFFKPVTTHLISVYAATTGTMDSELEVGHWRNTGAMTQIDITPVTATKKFKTGTTATLYGMP